MTSPPTAQFKRFQGTYLVVYAFMTAADWLQGPYQYELYAHYKYSPSDIGLLFIAGFGASAVFGTFAGSLADKYGRRLNCAMYAILYGASCVTKHYNNFWMLMFGRFLGGIATSILFSAFESWMVAEHNKRHYEDSWISGTFSWMISTNFAVAIGCGVLGQKGVEWYGGHPVAAFDLSLISCVFGLILVIALWEENYGNTGGEVVGQVSDALKMVRDDRKLWLLGALQSVFEGAMYTFVFMWTPTLKQSGHDVPLGYVFSVFMLFSAAGSYLYGWLAERYPVQNVMRIVFAISCCSMIVPIFTTNVWLLGATFCVFEATVGIFWPGIGTLRSRYVPEEQRATIMNIFRIPLNVLVCLLLLYVGKMSIATVFVLASVCHALCFCMQSVLISDIAIAHKEAEGGTTM